MKWGFGKEVTKMKIMKKTTGEKIFTFVIGIIIVLFSISVIYPFWNLLVTSFNDSSTGIMSGTELLPRKFTLANYKEVFKSSYIWIGYRETLFRTIVGGGASLLCTAMGAYALSKKQMPHRVFFSMFALIPMFFQGGLIPTYLWNVSLGLKNNRAVLILPGLVSAYNLIVMRNFFQGIPDELEESAKIDGAGQFRIFFQIILPLSKAALATVGLWIVVGHWNAWFDAMVYMDDPNRLPLQVVLRRILLEGSQQMMNMNMAASEQAGAVSPDTIKAATVFVCMVPILCVYPFIQKYFTKGAMIGAVKG